MAGRNRKAELLGTVPLFSACTDKDLARIASLTDIVDVPAGYVLAREGRVGREAFVISTGEAEVTLRGKLLARLGPGSIVGEMALLDMGPRSATVRASTDLRVLVLDQRSFAAMVEAVPQVARRILTALSQRLRAVQQQAA